jgi:hypothetical protein
MVAFAAVIGPLVEVPALTGWFTWRSGHPEVVQAMLELGVDLSTVVPRKLTQELASTASLLITMGCGESCPVVPGLERDDWPLEDPKGKSIERVRQIRAEIAERVRGLLRGKGWSRERQHSPTPPGACYCPRVSGPVEPEEIVTLVRFGELPAAQLLCGRLESEGIECLIPDAITAAQTWHLNRAIGGIRVQVRQSDLERAKQILEQPGLAEDAALAASAENLAAPASGEPASPHQDNKDDDGSISPGDRAAYRSMRVALVSLWLMGLIHPYSLVLAVQALRRKDITAWGRRRAGIALLVSVIGCAWISMLLTRFFSR